MWPEVISGGALVVVAAIELLAARDRKKDKAREIKEKSEAIQREHAREKMMIIVLESTGAALALGVATAHALQCGHSNGDMEAALQYAAQVKHKRNDFLTQQGVKAVWV